jgi:hypothetical protein
LATIQPRCGWLISSGPSGQRTKPKSEPVPFNQDAFKDDPLIQKVLEVFKGRIVEVRA